VRDAVGFGVVPSPRDLEGITVALVLGWDLPRLRCVVAGPGSFARGLYGRVEEGVCGALPPTGRDRTGELGECRVDVGQCELTS
jgi:hypothetical protein